MEFVELILMLIIVDILAFLKFWSMRYEKKTIICILILSNVTFIVIYLIKYRY